MNVTEFEDYQRGGGIIQLSFRQPCPSIALSLTNKAECQ